MKRFVILPLALAVAASLNAAAAGNSAEVKTTATDTKLTELPAKAPSDPLQAEDTTKAKKARKAKKTTPEDAVVNKPEPYVLDGKTPGSTAAPGTATQSDSASGTTSMTTPQPGRGGPTPPGVTDPPAASSGTPPPK